VDRRFAREIIGHDVQTVPGMGWAGKRNGELLGLAAAHFDVFITVDRNLPNQHDTRSYELAVAVLVARSNRIADLGLLIPQLLAQLDSLRPGEPLEIR
jgi:hypothetical protein